MDQFIDFDQIGARLGTLRDALTVRVSDPLFWLQFGVIAAVFVLARWLLTPMLKRGLVRLADSCTRVPSFRRPLVALADVANPIAWLILQWIAIAVFRAWSLPGGALTIIASLLTAWLLIRLVTMLVANEALARVIAISAWTIAALNIFGLLDDVSALLDGWAINLGGVRVSPLTIVKAGIALWLSLWMANGLATLVERRLERTQAVAPTMRVLGAKLTRIGLITAAFLVALSAVGIDLTALAVFGGALGVGLGFGLQKIFSNLVSGVILLMDRSIKPGDVISVGTTFGWINHLGARYASVITRDGIEHLIPNEELITQRVENWSYSNNLVRLRIPIGIAYHCDPREAIALCIEAAEMVPRVQLKPEPRCQLVGFGDSSLNLELRIWIDDPPNGRGNVISEVLLGVWDRFHEHGIEIPYPQRDLHLRSVLGEQQLQAIAEVLRGEAPSTGGAA
ncbi:MAG: mechanosensitive ion channel [Chromatiaceae bacterium]|nr:mechanosensitive ion channel [Gammaproteobacteria bacterium]MCP5305673.1 mechanosensitive ion channel [Chromatiaceae bacterium]MCP5312530.1 mechanosensitive ion channel [Chromatiaceae bacterium]